MRNPAMKNIGIALVLAVAVAGPAASQEARPTQLHRAAFGAGAGAHMEGAEVALTAQTASGGSTHERSGMDRLRSELDLRHSGACRPGCRAAEAEHRRDLRRRHRLLERGGLHTRDDGPDAQYRQHRA